MIATVIYNRLRQGTSPLGIDATSRYGRRRPERRWTSRAGRRTTRGDTRVCRRPRSRRPSRAAIHAALHPATGPWLYYVLTSPGNHTFAVTNEQFLAAKRICKAKRLGCG